MLKSTVVRVACGIVFLGLITTASVGAWPTARHTTYLTFSAPFALPGVSLPAGTYIFELAVPESRGDVVRVMSRDRTHVYLMAFTQTIDRPAGLPANGHVLFEEVRSGTTPPVKAWFPIGEFIGHEFIYAANSRQLGTGASN